MGFGDSGVAHHRCSAFRYIERTGDVGEHQYAGADIVLDGYNGEGEFSLVYGVADELDKTAMKRFKQLNYAMFEEYYLYGYMNYTYISDMDRNDQQDFYRIYNVAKYMTIQVYQVTDEGDIELIPDADDIYGGDLKNGDVIKIVVDCPKQYLDAARVRINVSGGTYVVSV